MIMGSRRDTISAGPDRAEARQPGTGLPHRDATPPPASGEWEYAIALRPDPCSAALSSSIRRPDLVSAGRSLATVRKNRRSPFGRRGPRRSARPCHVQTPPPITSTSSGVATQAVLGAEVVETPSGPTSPPPSGGSRFHRGPPDRRRGSTAVAGVRPDTAPVRLWLPAPLCCRPAMGAMLLLLRMPPEKMKVEEPWR